jgi:hypothetical protein
MSRLTNEELREWRTLCDVLDFPWRFKEGEFWGLPPVIDKRDRQVWGTDYGPNINARRGLVALSEAIPALLDEVAILRQERRQLAEAVDSCGHDCDPTACDDSCAVALARCILEEEEKDS